MVLSSDKMARVGDDGQGVPSAYADKAAKMKDRLVASRLQGGFGRCCKSDGHKAHLWGKMMRNVLLGMRSVGQNYQYNQQFNGVLGQKS